MASLVVHGFHFPWFSTSYGVTITDSGVAGGVSSAGGIIYEGRGRDLRIFDEWWSQTFAQNLQVHVTHVTELHEYAGNSYALTTAFDSVLTEQSTWFSSFQRQHYTETKGWKIEIALYGAPDYARRNRRYPCVGHSKQVTSPMSQQMFWCVPPIHTHLIRRSRCGLVGAFWSSHAGGVGRGRQGSHTAFRSAG